jgi:hypothetical protein
MDIDRAPRPRGRHIIRAIAATSLAGAAMLGLASQASAHVYDCDQAGARWYHAAVLRDYYSNGGVMMQAQADYWAGVAESNWSIYEHCS